MRYPNCVDRGTFATKSSIGGIQPAGQGPEEGFGAMGGRYREDELTTSSSVSS